MARRSEVLIFDVNETLLDLGSMAPRVGEVLESDGLMGEWFARLLHASLVANHTDRYRPFGTIASEVLLVMARRRGVDPGPAAAEVADMMRRPPPRSRRARRTRPPRSSRVSDGDPDATDPRKPSRSS